MAWRLWGGKVGIVDLFGVITGKGQAAEQVRLLNRLKESRRFKAVVINIDSPGGLATASNLLFAAVSRLAAAKPTIAFIGGTGASGAYMVSCGATRIVALPGSIVGSIGVLSTRPILHDLLHKLGVEFHVSKSGQLKDMGAFYRRPTPEEKEKELRLVEGFHRQFVQLVARQRKLDEAVVQGLATGEVFLAEEAKELKLVDELGDLDTAIDLACSLAHTRRRVVYLRPKQSMLQRLLVRGPDAGALLPAELDWLIASQVLFLGPGA